MQHRKSARVTRQGRTLVFLGVLCWFPLRTTGAHVFISEWLRVGSYPPYDGKIALGCKSLDFDDDGDVDMHDYTAFQDAYTGPGGAEGGGE